MRIEVEGEVYDYDDEKMSVAEARVIKKQAGMGVTQWAEALRTGDPDALVALVFLAKTRAGEAPKWSDFDELDLVSGVNVLDEDDDADQGEGDDAGADESGKPAPAAPAEKTVGKTQNRAS